MTSSKSRNLTSTLRRRARRSQPSQQGSTTTSIRRQRNVDLKEPKEYIGHFSTRERVDMVLHGLFQQHRWSIKDLLRNMVTAEPAEKHAQSCLVRARALSDAIWKQEEVVEMLAQVSQDIRAMDNSALVDRIRAELQK